MTKSRKAHTQFAAPGKDALLHPDWCYIEHTTLDDFEANDWKVLNKQRESYRAETLAQHVLRLLSVSKDDPTFGYQVNNYHHSLQTATLMYKDGLAENDVVLGLLHDIGFTLCPDTHAEFAANVLGPYLSARNRWILLQHPVFQTHHIHGYPGLDSRAREALRGHQWFEDCAHFVERYDIISIDPGLEVPALEFFVPMVHRFFAHPLAD
ncbi:MAG: phosphohydrolase [Gammaproteobacteria bacterium]|nr:phosphohydrolase [Gammaproteobacteria bacterium]